MSQKFQNQSGYATLKRASHIILTQLFPKHTDPDEVKRKGTIFAYFFGVTCFVLAILTMANIYSALTLEESLAQKNVEFVIADIVTFIFFGLIWWAHRWYPNLMRHLFLSILVSGTIFLFEIDVLGRIAIALALPIIMAAFLIQPGYSFVYYIFIACLHIFRLYLDGIALIDRTYFYINLISLLFLATLAWLVAHSLNNALAETKALNKELDQRVQDRTRELATALKREQTTAVRNKTILESIADGIIVFDADHQVLMANPAANQLARSNLQSLSMTRLLDAIQDEARELLQAWLMGQPPPNQTNIKFEWHDKTLSANVAPVILPQEGNKQVDAGSVMVLRDFTREAQLERAKDLFLGTVSHELRTPMSAIQGYVEVLLSLKKEVLLEEGPKYLQIINVSVQQLLTLANDLIDVSRLETGEVELYCRWMDIEPIVNDAVKMVQQEFASRNLTLEVIIEKPLPKLYLDARRILQILLNLLSNAYKYTPQGGATITISQTGDWVNIAIADTGAGIKAEDQANLFKRFFRANDRVIQRAGGTGLGLNISKGFTELHGGKLSVESQYGVGTTFTIALPQNPPEAVSDIAMSDTVIML